MAEIFAVREGSRKDRVRIVGKLSNLSTADLDPRFVYATKAAPYATFDAPDQAPMMLNQEKSQIRSNLHTDRITVSERQIVRRVEPSDDWLNAEVGVERRTCGTLVDRKGAFGPKNKTQVLLWAVVGPVVEARKWLAAEEKRHR